MKISATIIAIVFAFFICSASCSNDNEITPPQNEFSNTSSTKMKITIGNAVFTATLYDNASANTFKAMLPLTLNMTELNENEKYYDLPNSLPTNASVGGEIKAGDITLYGNNVLVLFYKKFTTSYSYTKLGFIDNPSGLAAALGNGNVVVKFELN